MSDEVNEDIIFFRPREVTLERNSRWSLSLTIKDKDCVVHKFILSADDDGMFINTPEEYERRMGR